MVGGLNVSDRWQREVERIRRVTRLPIELVTCPREEREQRRTAYLNQGGEILAEKIAGEEYRFIGIPSAQWPASARALLRLMLEENEEQSLRDAAKWILSPENAKRPDLSFFRWEESHGCFLLHMDRGKTGADELDWGKLFQSFFSLPKEPMLLPLGSDQLLLLVPASRLGTNGSGEEEKAMLLDSAYGVHELILSEAMVNVKVFVSLPLSHPDLLPEAYRKLNHLQKVISYMFPSPPVAGSWQYPLERWLLELPDEERNRLREELPLRQSPPLSAEQVETLHAFFANDLNVSETARTLFVHRNTLLYRLDKLREMTGLDPRNFENAMLLRLSMILRQFD